MQLPWQNGTVIRIENESAGTRRFWIEMESKAPFDFTPGQFVTLDLPIHEKPARRWRSYSIASWPDGTAVIELVIVLLDQGAGTRYLFNDVSVGSTLSVRGPLGVFALPAVLEKTLFLICTGTGIAPFRSMVHHIVRHGLAHRDIHLVFGCRTFGDALYRKEMEELASQEPGFFYHPVFSRERPELPGIITGYVHAVYEGLCRKEDTSSAASVPGEPVPVPASFFLCGWKDMIDEARERIALMGYERKDLHFEIYG